METAALETPKTEATIYPTVSDRVQSTFIDTIFIVILMLIAGSWLSSLHNNRWNIRKSHQGNKSKKA